MPVCPNCGSQQPDQAAFCDECGARLGAIGTFVAEITADPLVCSRCGARLEPGSKFCDMCGTPARAGAPPVPRSRPALTPSPVPASPSAQPAPAIFPSPAPHPPGTAIPGYLVVQGTNTTLRFPPGKTEAIIGRGDLASAVYPDVDLSSHGGDEGGVSRRHARIFVQGSQVLIEDLHSTNRTYVNQQRLVPGQPHPIRHGDEVRCGQVRLHFYST